MKRRTSIIWKISKDELQQLFDTSYSKKEVLNKLGLDSYGNYKTLYKRLQEEEFNLTKHYENYRLLLSQKNTHIRLSNEEIFVENSKASRPCIKKRILKERLLKYECFECDNNGTWNNKELVLQLEHKNGINNDHRLENLIFLCPNCHSQSKFYGGRNSKKKKINYKTHSTIYKKKEQRFCKNCGDAICDDSKSGLCFECYHIEARKVLRPTYEELKKDLITMNYCAVGRKYGVSDNTIRKWLKYYED